MNKIKAAKLESPRPDILIVDHSRRSARVYSLQTHNKAALPIKASRSLMKLKNIIPSPNKTHKNKPSFVPPKQQTTQPLTKPSTRPYNMIESFCIATHHGLHYLTNEDSISIQLGSKSMFGLFDGYNGNFASSFLKRMLMQKIQWNSTKTIETNIYEIFEKLDGELLKQQEKIGDSSGTSGIICLFYKEMVYTANCGTSLAFGKTNTGKLMRLNNVHDCDNEQERLRVAAENKAAFYRVKIELDENENYVEGPLRLSHYKTVQTRTLGYPLTKDRKVVISKPQIKFIKTENLEWVCMTTSGLLSVLSDIEIYSIIEKQILENNGKVKNYHKLADKCVKSIVKEGLRRKCMQNISVIVVFVGEMLAEEDTRVRKNRSNTSTQVASLNISFNSLKGRNRKITSMDY